MQRSIVPAPHFLARNLKDECQRILTLTGAPNPDIRAIAQHTVLMPSLAKAVVNHVNSIGHRRKHPIRDAEHAVVFLGAERLHQLVRKMRDQSDATPASDAVEPAPSAQPSSFGASFNAPVRRGSLPFSVRRGSPPPPDTLTAGLPSRHEP